MKAILFSLLFLSAVAQGTFAQNKPITDSTQAHWSVETDPSAFILQGYALHFRFKPRQSKHWVIGAGTYALDMPALMVDMNPKNKQQGWKVRIEQAYSLFGEYYFNDKYQGYFVGLQVGIQSYKNSQEQQPQAQMQYSSVLLMPSFGYHWRIKSSSFYVKPWAGLGYTHKISGSNVLEQRTYDIAPLVPFVTLHVGYYL